MPWLAKAKGFAVVFLILIQSTGFSQVNDSLDRTKLRWTIAGESAAYAGAMGSLYFVWYKDQPLTGFHFFDDSGEWMQMDKAGHFGTAALFSEYSYDLYRNCGMGKNKAAWWASAQSLFFLTSLELLDGFSRDWGFSWSDMAANVGGAGFFLAQKLFWDEGWGQKMRVKFSAHTTYHAGLRPEILGNDFPSRILKDYNGQTFWLSINPSSVFNLDHRFPVWLNLAFGYGAEGMLGGHENPVYNNKGEQLPQLQRYRQGYFSLDIDLKKIPTNKKWLKVVFSTLNWIKIPFPTMEISQGKVLFHPFYF